MLEGLEIRLHYFVLSNRKNSKNKLNRMNIFFHCFPNQNLLEKSKETFYVKSVLQKVYFWIILLMNAQQEVLKHLLPRANLKILANIATDWLDNRHDSWLYF